MPVVSTNGPKNQVTPVFAEASAGPVYVFAPDDTYASVQPDSTDPTPRTPSIALPTGAKLQLPGPDVVPAVPLPSNGDYYRFADPLGRIGVGAKFLLIDGGGYPIFGAAQTGASVPFSEGEFTFDDAAQAWIACICLPSED